MSHVTQIKTVPIKDMSAIQQAVAELGGVLVLGQKKYKWYGRSVGDTALPVGVKVEDLGKCEHAIKFPGINYEVGLTQGVTPAVTTADGTVIPGEAGLFPNYDYWGFDGSEHDGHKLKKLIGDGAGKLMQAYSKFAAINAATQAGYTVMSNFVDAQGNVQLELAVG